MASICSEAFPARPPRRSGPTSLPRGSACPSLQWRSVRRGKSLRRRACWPAERARARRRRLEQRRPRSAGRPRTGRRPAGRAASRPAAVVPAPPWWTTAATRGNSEPWGARSTTMASALACTPLIPPHPVAITARTPAWRIAQFPQHPGAPGSGRRCSRNPHRWAACPLRRSSRGRDPPVPRHRRARASSTPWPPRPAASRAVFSPRAGAVGGGSGQPPAASRAARGPGCRAASRE